jgi:hypothetical protein
MYTRTWPTARLPQGRGRPIVSQPRDRADCPGRGDAPSRSDARRAPLTGRPVTHPQRSGGPSSPTCTYPSSGGDVALYLAGRVRVYADTSCSSAAGMGDDVRAGTVSLGSHGSRQPHDHRPRACSAVRVPLPHNGHDATSITRPANRTNPVHATPLPLEIFSVSRLVRALRWAIVGGDARRYPYLVRMSADERTTLAECSWVEHRAGSVAILRAPVPDELHRLTTLLKQPHPRRSSDRAGEHEARRLRDLRAALEEAASATALLEVCPVCAKTDPDRPTTFEPRDGGLFAASCPSCRTRWELRRCPACNHTFPLLAPDALAATGAPEPDLDRHLGGTFLAIPCWAEGRTGHALCPACGTCGQATRVPSCPGNCSARARS